MVKLLPCDHEVMGSKVLETASCRNAGKDCVHKTLFLHFTQVFVA
jgi:hypothetical protein